MSARLHSVGFGFGKSQGNNFSTLLLSEDHMEAFAPKKRILILGGGFGGVYTARYLEWLIKGRSDVEIVLVSQGNFLLMTPLLFEVFFRNP